MGCHPPRQGSCLEGSIFIAEVVRDSLRMIALLNLGYALKVPEPGRGACLYWSWSTILESRGAWFCLFGSRGTTTKTLTQTWSIAYRADIIDTMQIKNSYPCPKSRLRSSEK